MHLTILNCTFRVQDNSGPHLLHSRFNPLTPVPAVTGRAKTHPQFPVPAVTGRKKARGV